VKFTTAEILSVSTGVLFCQIERVYAILNYLTRDSLFTHQLPRASRACKEPLRRQLPWLAEVNAEAVGKHNYREFLAAVVARHGAEHEIQPLPPGTWEHKNPFTELDEILSKKEES
jgi:hypothetical protein